MKRHRPRKMFFIMLLLCSFTLMASGLDSPGSEQLEEKLAAARGRDKLQYLNILARKYGGAEIEKSQAHARHMLDLAQELNDTDNMVQALNHMGANYYIANRFRESLQSYLKALEYSNAVKEKEYIARILTNTGMVYWRLEQYIKAEEYHRRAVAFRKRHGGPRHMLAWALNNLGLAIKENGENEEALKYFEETLIIAREASHRRYQVAALNNLGVLYLEHLEIPSKAMEYYRQTLSLYQETGNLDDIARAHGNIGRTFTAMNRLDKARLHLEKALELSLQSGQQYQLYPSYSNLVKLEIEAGNYQAALNYRKKYEAISEKLFDETSTREIARMEARLESEKKEHQLKLLRREGENRRLFLIFLGVVAVLCLILAALAYGRFRARKKANLLLKAEETRYRTLFDNASEAIMLSVPSGYIQCNRKALEMFGVTMDQIKGRNYMDFSPPRQPDGRESAITGAEYRARALKGESMRFNWQYLDKNGAPLEAAVSLSPIRFGQDIIIQVIAHDINDRVRLEEERIKAAKLETTNQLAEGIAHDINNLLTIILGNLDMAIDDAPEGSSVKPLLQGVEKAAKNAEELAKQFKLIAEGQLIPQ